MKTLFQKLTTLSEIFHKEPPKKLIQQKRSPRQKIAFAALATFTALEASYLTYQYFSPKIKIPNSVSNTINTAFKVVGLLTALAGIAGLLAYKSSVQLNNLQQKNFNTNTDNDLSENSLKETIYNDIEKLFYEFRVGEKINKDLLEKLITTHIDLRKTLSKSTNSNKKFILNCVAIIKGFQIIFFTSESTPNVKISNLNKIIDVLDIITDRTDLLSCRLINQLFPDIIPNGLHKMTQMLELEDKECQEMIVRSHQLIYKALTQQMKILFKDGIFFKTQASLDKAFHRILGLLTPFKDDHFRLSPNFYVNFFLYSPKLAWQFFQIYIFENIFKEELSLSIDSSPDMIIADFLNARDSKDGDDNDNPFSNYTYEDGLDILKKIMLGARLSLFLEDSNQMAASFAIRLMQHKLEMDPKDFEKKFPRDNRLLKQLYFEMCGTENLKLFEDFASENEFHKQAARIVDALISECATTSLVNLLFGSDITKLGQAFINKIVPLSQKKDYSEDEKSNIRLLSFFIRSQILDPSIPQRAELAVLALNNYSEVFHNEESVNLIREAYKSQLVKHKDLNSACQKFLTACKNLPEISAEVDTEIKNPQLANSTNLIENPMK